MAGMINVGDMKSEKCYGCFACSNICPSHCIVMDRNAEGFMTPYVDQKKCVKCGRCLEVCPARIKKSELRQARRRSRTKVYGAQIKDNEIRYKSTSGGMFYAFAKAVVEKGGCVYGAAFDKDNKVVHICAGSLREAERCMKSKYAQSDLGDVFREIERRSQKQQVLFTGTPCQVAAIKRYEGIKKENLICIENICHGIPSPGVWELYLEEKKKEHGEIRRIIFRDKEINGWNQSGTTILFHNGFEYRSSLNGDPFIEAFLKGYSLRETCYDCRFKGRTRYGDLTIGDFPDVSGFVNRFRDNMGTSTLIINSDVGHRLVEEVRDAVVLKRIYSKKALIRNWSWYLSYPYTAKRKVFFENCGRGNLSVERCIKKADLAKDEKTLSSLWKEKKRELQIWCMKYCFKL